MQRHIKVALVYDRVNKWGGAERVLLALHELFPEAPLFTSVYSQEGGEWAKVFPKVIPSFLQQIPFAKDNHEYLACFMPLAFRSHNMDGYDLVISVTSEFAKAIKTHGLHICYCLTPTRYLWSSYNEYFRNSVLRIGSTPLVYFLRKLDKKVSQKPDVIVSISSEVRKRVKKYYGRNSKIIFPPVDVSSYRKNPHLHFKNSLLGGPTAASRSFFENTKSKYYLVVSRLVSYKKVDLAIEAFNELGLPLVIVGTGKEEKRLKEMANKNIKFVGQVSDSKLASYYVNCKALIFPQLEDFGIVAVEAQAFGAPVIAYKGGGAIDTVIDSARGGQGPTGVFFKKQEKESLINAVKKFEKMKFKKSDLIRNVKKFSSKRFKKEFLALVESL